MLGDFITRCLLLLLGYAYPAFECYKTVEKNKVEIEELRFWCQYWILVAFLTVFERIADTFISWLPMYGELKLTLFLYLWYPKTKGTGYVYDSLLRPYFAKHETDIERKIRELRARAWDFAIYYWQNCTELGQAKFFDLLQYLAGQSSRFSQSGNLKADQQNGSPSARSQSGKSKKWFPSAPPAPGSPKINRAVADSPRSKLEQVDPDIFSQTEYAHSKETEIPSSPMNDKLHQAQFRLRRTKPQH